MTPTNEQTAPTQGEHTPPAPTTPPGEETPHTGQADTTQAQARAALLADDAAQAAAAAIAPPTPTPAAGGEAAPAGTPEHGTPPLIALGTRGAANVYYNTKQGRLYELPPREHTRLPLLNLAPFADYAAWLEPNLPLADALKRERAILNEAARLLLEATAGRVYDDTAIRARGIWRDDTPAGGGTPTPAARGFIYNAGDAVYYAPGDGVTPPAKVDPVRGRHIYTAGAPLPAPAGAPLTPTEGRALVDYLAARSWACPYSGELLAGWLVNALMAGAMTYRGHIWVNAPRNTGKTFLRDNLLDLLGAFVYFSDGAVSTPAALRAGLNGSPLPVLADEQDPNAGDSKSAANVDKKLELARIASKGGKVSMGSTGGAGVTRDYWLLSCFLFLSIDNALDRDSDLTRWAILRLCQAPPAALNALLTRQATARGKMTARDSEPAGGSFIARLIARLLMEGNAILRNAGKVESVLIKAGAESRAAEMFSVWAAGVYAITAGGDMEPPALTHALKVWQAYTGQDDSEDDFTRCIDTLRAAPVQFQGARLSVGVLCSKYAVIVDGEEREAIRAALLSIGLSFTTAGNIALQDSQAFLRPLFRGTEYERRAKSVLTAGCSKDCPVNVHGVKLSTVRAGTTPRRAIVLPAALLYTPTRESDED